MALCPTLSWEVPPSPALGLRAGLRYQGSWLSGLHAWAELHRRLSWAPSLRLEANSSEQICLSVCLPIGLFLPRTLTNTVSAFWGVLASNVTLSPLLTPCPPPPPHGPSKSPASCCSVSPGQGAVAGMGSGLCSQSQSACGGVAPGTLHALQGGLPQVGGTQVPRDHPTALPALPAASPAPICSFPPAVSSPGPQLYSPLIRNLVVLSPLNLKIVTM